VGGVSSYLVSLEGVATLLGLINITLLVRRSIWNYPFGLAMVALYADIFLQAKLYSDAILQLFFFVIQLYGWWAWWRVGGAGQPIAVLRLTTPARIAWAVMIALITALWGQAMHAYTDASFPWWDGGIAVTSVAAQILLARRRLENWVLWILVDVAAIGLYAVKGLALTAGLYVVFLILSAVGLRQWLRAEAAGAAAR
jgi:nicotinamide mononucleotide transporter